MNKDVLSLALAQLNPVAGDLKGNAELALNAWMQARKAGADIIAFSEGFLTGYFVADLVLNAGFLSAVQATLERLAAETFDGPDILIGAIRWDHASGKTRNSVFHLSQGKIADFRDKAMLPNEGVYDEKRVMEAGPMPGPISIKGMRFGIPICEDIWSPDVVECLTETGAEIILSVNGSVFDRGKYDERLSLASARVAESGLPLIYLNMVGGQDEVVFDGASFALERNYKAVMQLPAFMPRVAFLSISRDKHGMAWLEEGEIHTLPDEAALLYQAAVLALRDYVIKSGFSHVLLGLSGGVDSSLVAAMAVDALGADKVHTVMLPYHYTSQGSLDDARMCAERLGVSHEIMAINTLVEPVFDLLDAHLKGPSSALARENTQSRARGLLLMTLANASGALLLTTGNKSEVAVGYATLYGDMNGGFNPLKDIYKTDVYTLCRWRNQLDDPAIYHFHTSVVQPIPATIIDKAPSAELRENQRDDDNLPPYERLDAMLEYFIERDASVDDLVREGYDRDEAKRVQALLYRAEFKRFQAAPGPKLSRKSLGLERRYPIVNRFTP